MVVPRYFLLYSNLIGAMVQSGLLRGRHVREGPVFEGTDVRCVEDPNGVGCQGYQQQQSNLIYTLNLLEDYSSGLFHRKKDLIIDDSYWENTDQLVSSAPTRDMCYGNMERIAYKKFCHSEMPSVSLEPSYQPSLAPEYIPVQETSPSPAPVPPTAVPSAIITRIPSSVVNIPSSGLGMCQGDCDSPTDCAEGLYCYQRMASEQTPGCPGTELDASRTDYCTNVTISTNPNDPVRNDAFRLKLYWNESYWWQESNTEIEWCMTCPPGFDDSTVASHPCQAGDVLLLQYCSSSSSVVVSFIFTNPSESTTTHAESVLIQIADSNLCVERQDMIVIVATCNATNPQQHWDNSTVYGPTGTFEISPPSDASLCMTIHHHPKHGEEVELYTCEAARHDTSSLWTVF